MDKPEVGQVVYSLNVGNAARRVEQKLTPYEVVKVGNLYFTARRCNDDSGWTDTQYHLDGWYEKTEYSANSKLYSSEQEWHDEREAQEIVSRMKKAFDFGGKGRQLPLESLRKIAAIIEVD